MAQEEEVLVLYSLINKTPLELQSKIEKKLEVSESRIYQELEVHAQIDTELNIQSLTDLEYLGE
jgi:hypothetical protein